MPQPTAYTRQADFTSFEASNPSTPKRGEDLDAEFDALKVTTDEIRTNLALIQADDGSLKNESVHPDAFDAEALALMGGSWTPRGAWVTATLYSASDVVSKDSDSYVCAVEHTSGTFNTDLAAGKWLFLGVGVSQATLETIRDAALAAETNAETAETNAETAQAAAAASATSAAGSATTASTQASNASTSATNAATSATNAANSATAAAGSATTASTAATAAQTAQAAAELAETNAETAEANAETAAASAASAAASAAAAAVATHTGDATDAHAASAITNTPSGNISSNTVQGAINELDSEKAATGHNHSGVYEPADADLTALAALSATGVVARTGAATYVPRTITGTANQITVTNGDGVSGNPTIAASVASQAEAEAGSDTTKLMTPQRVAQAIAALGGSGGGLVPIERKTGASVASYDFVTGINSTYRSYKLKGWLLPATDQVALWLRGSDDGGSTFEADASDYAWHTIGQANGTYIDEYDDADSEMEMFLSSTTFLIGNASSEGISFEINFEAPSSNALYKRFFGMFTYTRADGGVTGGTFHGHMLATAAMNGLRLLFSSGNIASGDVTLFGLENS